MVAVITASAPNVRGKVVTICCTTTATQGINVNLPSYAPKFDLTVECPIIQMFHLCTAVDFADSIIFEHTGMIARGAVVDAPDTAGEWNIIDLDTVFVYKTGATAGFVFITYIAAGAQLT